MHAINCSFAPCKLTSNSQNVIRHLSSKCGRPTGAGKVFVIAEETA